MLKQQGLLDLPVCSKSLIASQAITDPEDVDEHEYEHGWLEKMLFLLVARKGCFCEHGHCGDHIICC